VYVKANGLYSLYLVIHDGFGSVSRQIAALESVRIYFRAENGY
jgi:hypothetical protein